MSYKKIGDLIQLVDVRNKNLSVTHLVGLTINKKFIPSVANIIGTDMTNYKIIKKNQFACSTMQVRRDKKMPIALFKDFDEAIISQAYPVFEVQNEKEVLPDYMMLWFSRSEFDREACFHAVGGVRGSLEWEDFCNMELPIPSIEEQIELVKQYHTISDKIKVNEQICEKLETTAEVIFSSFMKSGDTFQSHRLGDLIEIKGGFSYNSENLGKGNTYLLGMGCVSFSERFVEGGMRLYSDSIPQNHLVKSKDIIIATRQQSENLPILGYPAMIPSNLHNHRLVIASNLYRVVNKSDLSNEFIFQLLKSRNYRERIKEQTKGTTVGMITKDAIEDYIFDAPPISDLVKIQSTLNKIVDNIFLKRTETQKLTEFQSLLLSRLATFETEELIKN